jgi:hypothetical protein
MTDLAFHLKGLMRLHYTFLQNKSAYKDHSNIDFSVAKDISINSRLAIATCVVMCSKGLL